MDTLLSDEDYICDNFNGVRVIMTSYEIYVQKEYMITGYEEDGTYNPCIDTAWKTLVREQKPIEKIRNVDVGYRTFSSLTEMIKFFVEATSEVVGFSSMYKDTEHIGEYKIIATEESIRRDYPEYLI